MEHLNTKWAAVFDERSEKWGIDTKEDEPWHICVIDRHLPGDLSGERTARFICELHNNHLDMKG